MATRVSKSGAPAGSRYRGLRVTLTQLPDGGDCLVSVSAKTLSGHWDEWSLLYPATRHPAVPLNGADEVLEFLHTTLGRLIAQG